MSTPKDLYDALVAFHKPAEAKVIDITKLRFVMYVRKSTTSDERQERSLSDQKLDCFDAAKRIGIPENNITVIEEQESAKEPDIRDKFKTMIQDIKLGKYDAILTWHPDRLARNMADAGKIIDLLDKKIIKNLSFATFSFEDTPMTYETFLELFGNIGKALQNSDDLAYRHRVIRLMFLNFVVDNEKVADVSLLQPFSDFLLQGDFLDGRASGI